MSRNFDILLARGGFRGELEVLIWADSGGWGVPSGTGATGATVRGPVANTYL